MTIRPGLGERLRNMGYATYSCGACINNGWCDNCKQSTLNANAGCLPSNNWDGKRKALEDFIQKKRDDAAGEPSN